MVRERIESFRKSLQLKLFIQLTVIVALSLAAVLASQIFLVQEYFIQQAESNLRRNTYLLSQVLGDQLHANDSLDSQERFREMQSKLRLCNFQLKDHQGQVVFRIGQVEAISDSEFSPNGGGRCYNTIIPAVHAGDLLGTARLGLRTDDIAQARNALIKQSVFFAAFWFVLFMLPFFLQIRRMVRPISEISRAAHELNDGNLSCAIPLPLAGNDELARLSTDFHRMADTFVHMRKEQEVRSAASNELKLQHENLAWMRNRLDYESLQRKAADEERHKLLGLLKQTEQAFGKLIPQQMLALMGKESVLDVKLGDQFERKLTVMCSDIRNFTTISESMTPQNNFDFLNSYLSHMEPIVGAHNGIIDKFIGDSILAIFTRGADDAVSGAIKMLEKLEEYNANRAKSGFAPLQIGFGLNTGLVMVGTVGGATRMDSTVIGDAVNITYRIEDATKTYFTPLLISQNTMYDLVEPEKYDLRFIDRIRVKGKKQPISIYEVFNNDQQNVRDRKRVTKDRFEMAIAYYHLKQIPRAMQLLKQCIDANPKDIPARIYRSRCEQYLTTGMHLSTGELNNHMQWRGEYQVHIDAVDLSHRHLFNKVNEFISASIARDVDKINLLLSYLEEHLVESKEEEEYLMADTDYPFMKHHQREHRRFINDFALLKEASETQSIDIDYLTFRIQLLMFDWFSGHIMNSDRHASRHILGAVTHGAVSANSLRMKDYLASVVAKGGAGLNQH